MRQASMSRQTAVSPSREKRMLAEQHESKLHKHVWMNFEGGEVIGFGIFDGAYDAKPLDV